MKGEQVLVYSSTREGDDGLGVAYIGGSNQGERFAKDVQLFIVCADG